MSSDDWPVLSLREAGVELLDCEHRTPPDAGCGYPYIAIPQIRDGHLDLSGARRVSHEHYVEWTRKAKPQPHDVLLSRRCNPGETAVVPSNLECVLGQNLVILRADGTRIAPSFLRWLVRSPVWWEQVSAFINVGAVFDSLRCADIPSFRLPIPPESEQLRIAAILDALDDRIELNRRMNRTLESMARAIFKSWFVDFDPVRRKMEGGDPEVPNEIAHGWNATKLAELVVVVRDTMTPQQIAGELVDHYSIPAFDDGKTPSLEMGSTIRSSKFRVPSGCVLVSRLNPRIPRVWLPRSRNERRGVCSTEFLVLLPKSPVSVEYLYGIACSERFGEELASRVTGTSGSHQRVKPLDALSIPVVLPLASMIDAYSSVVRPVLKQAGRLLRENLVLAELRDAMLPRLLSGSVRSGSQLVGRVG